VKGVQNTVSPIRAKEAAEFTIEKEGLLSGRTAWISLPTDWAYL